MADDPVIFRGSPADFSIFVDDFERRRRHGSTVFHVFPFRRGYVEVWPPESEHTAQIAAYALPGERALVECETLSPAAWPDIEPHWRDLLAELARLGLLESDAAPERRSGRGGGPSPQPISERAKWVLKWQEARKNEPRLGAAPWLARVSAGFSSAQLYRWARDPEVLAYIERNRASLHHSIMTE